MLILKDSDGAKFGNSNDISDFTTMNYLTNWATVVLLGQVEHVPRIYHISHIQTLKDVIEEK
jgi:hypothetical protein